MSIRKLSDGRWEWRHRVNGKHLKKVFGQRRQAVEHDSKVKADLARGVHIDVTNQTTVAEYFRRWSATRVIRDGTRERHACWLKVHLAGTPLGSRPLVKVKPSEVQAWAASRVPTGSAATVANHVIMLRAVFATAVDDGLIARNPVMLDRLSLPKQEKAKVVPLTVAQVQAWAEAADSPRTRVMILTQAMLGPRLGELLGLRVADIDFLRREVHITGQLDGRKKHRAPLKTPGSRRAVPLPQECAALLAEFIRTHQIPAGGYLFTAPGGVKTSISERAPLVAHLRDQGLTFAEIGEKLDVARSTALRSFQVQGEPRLRNLAPLCRKRTWRAYHLAAVAAGLPGGTSSHDLRHHYASVLLDAGESVHAVAERIGDTPQMVLQVYGHLMPGREDRTRKAISAAWQQAGQAADLHEEASGS